MRWPEQSVAGAERGWAFGEHLRANLLPPAAMKTVWLTTVVRRTLPRAVVYAFRVGVSKFSKLGTCRFPKQPCPPAVGATNAFGSIAHEPRAAAHR